MRRTHLVERVGELGPGERSRICDALHAFADC
jgi:hypothetical protein